MLEFNILIFGIFESGGLMEMVNFERRFVVKIWEFNIWDLGRPYGRGKIFARVLHGWKFLPPPGVKKSHWIAFALNVLICLYKHAHNIHYVTRIAGTGQIGRGLEPFSAWLVFIGKVISDNLDKSPCPIIYPLFSNTIWINNNKHTV